MTSGDFGFYTGSATGSERPLGRSAATVGVRERGAAWQRWDDKFDARFRWRRLGGWRWVLLGAAGFAAVLFCWGLLATPQYGQTRLGNALGSGLGALFAGGLIGGVGGTHTADPDAPTSGH